MPTKLTLRLDESLVRAAKEEARQRGKSVSQMVADYFESLGRTHRRQDELPPVTQSLTGILKGAAVTEDDYKTHLREKHL